MLKAVRRRFYAEDCGCLHFLISGGARQIETGAITRSDINGRATAYVCQITPVGAGHRLSTVHRYAQLSRPDLKRFCNLDSRYLPRRYPLPAEDDLIETILFDRRRRRCVPPSSIPALYAEYIA